MKNMGFHGSLNVPIEHHPTISYMVYNGYYKVMSNIPKMGQLITNHWILSFSNVGNNSPAPSYRFHRTFADGDFTLDFTDSDIDSAGISGTSKPWAGLMGKGSIILLHTFAPNILEVVWIPIPCHVLWLSICFACDGPGVRNFGEKTSQWQLTTAVYGTIFRGFNSQLGMVTFCLRLFSGLLHYCRRQIKTWTCSPHNGYAQRWKASVLVYPQIFFTGSWRTQYKHHLWTSIPAGNGLVTSDNVCIPTVPSGNLT